MSGSRTPRTVVQSWRQAHVAGPTDLRTAPLPATTTWANTKDWRRSAAAASPRSSPWRRPQARNGPTDIFFARIGPG